MPLVDDLRYACKNCIKGHRTKSCDCFDQSRQKELVQRYSDTIQKCAPVSAPDNDVKIALFEKTMKSGRPSNEEMSRNKETKTYYILVKVASEGNQCRVAGKFHVDRDSEQVLSSDQESGTNAPNRNCCTQTSPLQANSSSRPMQPKPQLDTLAPNHLQLGHIISMNGTRKQHKCHCGSGCTCAFCPQHPQTESTRQILAETIDQRMLPQNLSGSSYSMSIPPTQVQGCNGSTYSSAAITDNLQGALTHFPNYDSNTDNLFIAEFNFSEGIGGSANFPQIPQNTGFRALPPILAGQPVSQLQVDPFPDTDMDQILRQNNWILNPDLADEVMLDPNNTEILEGNYSWQGPP